jgi:hypothetical protein
MTVVTIITITKDDLIALAASKGAIPATPSEPSASVNTTTGWQATTQSPMARLEYSQTVAV